MIQERYAPTSLQLLKLIRLEMKHNCKRILPATTLHASVASDPIGPLVTMLLRPKALYISLNNFNSYPPALAEFAQQQGLGEPQCKTTTKSWPQCGVKISTTFSSLYPENFLPIGAGSVLRRPTSISQQSHLQQYDWQSHCPPRPSGVACKERREHVR
jgi:hypothetical protein